MSKKMMKRSLALGALMAFVITGSAWAQDVDSLQTGSVNVQSEETINYKAGIELLNKDFTNSGKVNVTGDLIFDETNDAGHFKNTGELTTETLDVYSRQKVEFAGKITATEKFIYRGVNGEASLDNSLQLTTPNLELRGEIKEGTAWPYYARLIVSNGKVLDGVEDILINSINTQAALVIHYGAKVEYDNTITLQSTDTAGSDARIELYNGSSIELENLVVNGPAGSISYSFDDTSTQGGTATIKNITINNDSTLDLAQWTQSDKQQRAANYNLSNIVIGDNGKLFASANWGADGTDPKNPLPTNSSANIIGNDITMQLGKNAIVDFGGRDETDPTELGDKIFVNASSMTINTEDGNAKVYLSDAALKIGNENALKNEDITVKSTVDLEEIKDVVRRTNDSQGANDKAEDYVAEGVKLVRKIDDVSDIDNGVVGVKDNGESYVIRTGTSKKPDTYGVTENNALSLITWRAEMNDMNKRMGELRNANGEHGVWVRMVRGEDEYESINHQYNQYQLGYDEKLSVDPSWTVGVALSYTEGDSTYSTGSAENKHKGLSIYGSKLNEDGTFVDLIAKYARLENDFKNTWGTGDYSTNGYSVSAEFGKRIKQGGGVWIEPQVELTYGKVSAADYKINTIDIAQDGIESLVGRVGFSLGKDIKQGNVYARASYLYDFDGETKSTFVDTASGSNKPRTMKDDLGGGWWEVGLGTNINLSKATYIYADIEKTFGGEVDTNWQWNLGVRYSF